MPSQDDIIARFDGLIADLSGVPPSTGGFAYPGGDWRVIVRVAISGLSLVQLVFGRGAAHEQLLQQAIQAPEWANRTAPAATVAGILESARDDFAGGYYGSLRSRVAAEVFDDLLDMAEHLPGSEAHIPAAMLAGAVLEDTLRKLCDANDLDRDGCSGISALNDRLKASALYQQPQWRQIQVWADLRNLVDHHNFDSPDEVDAQAVEHMIAGVRELIVRHLG